MFLERYGIVMAAEDTGLLELTMAVANGQFTLEQVQGELELAAERAMRR